MAVSLVGVSGSTRRPSRTSVLLRAIVDAVADRLDLEPRIIELADAVVGTPVYRGSYTGALKHLFDLIHHDALAGTPVVLAATGGSALYGLVTEHQLRPLFGFFRALSLPTAVYATEADFSDGVLTNPAILQRIDRAADEVAELVAGGPRLCAVPFARRRIPAGA
jgi:FMN reductase